MKIKQLSVASLVIVGTLGLTSCVGGGGNAPADGGAAAADGKVAGTLTGIFSAQFRDTYEKIAAAFEEEYPDVDVQFEYQGGDIGQLVMTQLQGGTAPDLLTSFPGGVKGDNADTVVPLAAAERILPLDVTWADQIPEGWEDQFGYEGEIYAYPGAFQPLTSIYNATKLEELGLSIPTTLDEVFGFCADAQAKGVYAYAQGLGDAAAGPQMLSMAHTATLMYGPDPAFDDKITSGEVTYPESPWVDQFEIYQRMFDEGCFGEGALGRTREQGGTEVGAGKALAIVDVGGALPGLITAGPDNEYRIAPMPATNDGESFMTALAGFVTTINAGAENPAAAQAFMEFLGQPDISAIYAEGFQSVPVLPNDEYTPPAALEAFAAAVAEGTTAPLPTVQAEVQSTLNQQLQAMFLGNTTPDGVAQSMQDVHRDL